MTRHYITQRRGTKLEGNYTVSWFYWFDRVVQYFAPFPYISWFVPHTNEHLSFLVLSKVHDVF